MNNFTHLPPSLEKIKVTTGFPGSTSWSISLSSFRGLSSLTSLSLKSRITVSNAELNKMTSLKHLSLRECFLRDTMLEVRLPRLISLNFNRGRVSIFAPQLRELKLRNANLIEIGASPLVSLDLRNCSLGHAARILQGKTRLDRLSLRSIYASHPHELTLFQATLSALLIRKCVLQRFSSAWLAEGSHMVGSLMVESLIFLDYLQDWIAPSSCVFIFAKFRPTNFAQLPRLRHFHCSSEGMCLDDPTCQEHYEHHKHR
jgi:hypothetical protein